MFLTNILPSLFFLFYSCEPALKRENISQIQGISLTQKIQIYANGQEIPDTLNWHVDIYTHEEKLLYADLIDFFVMNNGTMEIKKIRNFFLQTKSDSYGYFFDNCKPMIDTCKGYSGQYKMKLPAADLP